MNINELNFPKIKNQSNHIIYGGNQGWFAKKWQRQAGCASTSGANLATYYAMNFNEMRALFPGNTDNLKQEKYLEIMENMFEYMKPGVIGFPYASKFAKRFTEFCLNKNIRVESKVLKKWNSTKEASDFITNSIDNGHPVALLILFHHGKELRNDNWHWVTITGYTNANGALNQVILSNGGRRQLVSADVLLEKHPCNIVRMVSFTIM
ncbi:MAG: hypothetical protein GX913_04380 [Clostridiales bacterium]|nr:hypothetical protein [Clostridiales bacterium]